MEIASKRQTWTDVVGRVDRGRPESARRLREAPDPAAFGSFPAGRTSESARQGASELPDPFEILRRGGESAPYLAPVGTDVDGRAIWVDLHHPSSRHVLIEGGTAAARGEMLRALAIGLSITTRPALLQVLTIDGTGRELTVLETLPHAVTETAGDAASAQVNLLWLAAELEARVRDGRRWPDMLLVVEDVLSLAGSDCGRGRAALTTILRSGGGWGIHVLGAAANLTGGLRTAGWSRPVVARLIAGDAQGSFEYIRGGRCTRLAGVRLTAVDLDLVARGRRPARARLERPRPIHPPPGGWGPGA